MANTAKIYPITPSGNTFQASFILELSKDGDRAKLDMGTGNHHEIWGRIPVDLQAKLEIGDEVLIGGENDFFILSLLLKKNPSPKPEHPPLKVFSSKKELLFEYDPKSNKSRVFINRGNLEFITQDGDIILNASKDLKLQAGNIDIASATQVKIGVDAVAGQQPAIQISPQKLNLSSPNLDLLSQHSTMAIDEMHYTGKNCAAKIKSMSLMGQKMSVVVKTISQKAENLFQKIKGLSQLRASRQHTIVDESYHLKAKQVILKADRDFKVKGDKIHLG